METVEIIDLDTGHVARRYVFESTIDADAFLHNISLVTGVEADTDVAFGESDTDLQEIDILYNLSKR